MFGLLQFGVCVFFGIMIGKVVQSDYPPLAVPVGILTTSLLAFAIIGV